jgi:ABC-type antimicrobial peptide transport system permease subunit
VEDVKPGPGESIRTHYSSGVAGDYWLAMGIPLIEGRFLEDADSHRAERVCVVDQSVAQRYWPGKSALGRRLTNGPVFTNDNAVTVVGVVGNVKQGDLADRSPMGAIYYPYQAYASNGFSVVVRTPLDPSALGAGLQKTVLSLDPDLPLDDLKPMDTLVSDSLVTRRSPAVLAAIFSAVALLLAAVGTYGVLAYAVNQRRREIGVRMALGAQPGAVRNQFLKLGATLLAAGLGLGALAAWGVGRALQNILFEMGSLHGGVLALAAAVMSIIVLVAVYLPSRRAAHIDPLEALRDD